MLSQMEFTIGGRFNKQTIDHMSVINRLGDALSSFASSPSSSSTINILQFLDDYAVLHQHIIRGDPSKDFLVYSYLVIRFFSGVECDYRTCPSIAWNGRDRMEEVVVGQMESNGNGEQHIHAIHCALMHGYDCGYKMYQKEREMVTESLRNADGNFAYDYEAVAVRKAMGQRAKDMRGGGRGKGVNSKFVTVIAEEVGEQKQQGNSNSNSDSTEEQKQQSQQRPSQQLSFYAFGYRFYYWEWFKNNERIDRDYNGGGDAFGVWFIEKKYESFKAELINAKLPMQSIYRQTESAQIWMATDYVKEMIYFEECQNSYKIPYRSPISISHILSVLFHCNFTALCTLFSSTFRKLTANESDDELRQRNANFREFGRLLAECVHGFGTKVSADDPHQYYHGISRVMHFPSTVAQFCSPTSTTGSIAVAINFATAKGMILELESTGNCFVPYFNCSIISDFRGEDERLFFQGQQSGGGTLANTSLSFVSIRLLQQQLNLRLYVSVISRFQQFIRSTFCHRPFRSRKDFLIHHRCWRFLWSEKMNNYGHDSGNNNNNGEEEKEEQQIVPMYVQMMFDRAIEAAQQNITEMEMIADVANDRIERGNAINEPSGYLLFRDTFCDVYGESESGGGRQLNHPMICGVKLDVICRLLTRLKRITLTRFTLSTELMDHILRYDFGDGGDGSPVAVAQIQTIHIGNARDGSDNTNSYLYNEMASIYQQQLDAKKSRMHLNVKFGEWIEIIRLQGQQPQNVQEQQNQCVLSLLSPLVRGIMMQRDISLRWMRLGECNQSDVKYYRRLFSRIFCLPPASFASASVEFDSFARILLFCQHHQCGGLLQEVMDYLSVVGDGGGNGDNDIRSVLSSLLSNLKIPPQSFDHLIRAVSIYPRLICPFHRNDNNNNDNQSPPFPSSRYSPILSSSIRSLWLSSPSLFPMQVDMMVVGKGDGSESNNNGSDRISIAHLLNAHGIECVGDTLTGDYDDDNNNAIASAFESVIHSTPIPHPRVIVAIDERLMEVVVYVVNPIYVDCGHGFYKYYPAATPEHCIYQTAHYLLPMNKKPVKHWQMTTKCKYRSVILSNNLLLWSNNENESHFHDNQWMRLRDETHIETPEWMGGNEIKLDYAETFSFDSKTTRDKWFTAISSASKQQTIDGNGNQNYYYYVPRSGKRDKYYHYDGNNRVTHTSPSPSSTPIADRIQPWTGANDPTCYSVLGGGCKSGSYDFPVVISFHCSYHTPNDIRKYMFYNGKWKRMMNLNVNGNEDNENDNSNSN